MNERKRRGFVIRGDDPRQDFRPVAIGDGFELPRRLTVELHRDNGVVEVTIVTEKRKSRDGSTVPAIRVTDVTVTAPDGGDVDDLVLERVGSELDGIVRHALVEYLGTFAQDDRAMSRQLKRPVEGRLGVFEWNDAAVDELWQQVIAAMYPAKDRESASAYVLRLWESLYEPAGKRQRQLADDLGLKLETVRVYVANARRAREKGAKK